MFEVRDYKPAGPVLKAFHESSAFVRLVAGPIGSGKTTAAGVAEMFFTAMTQGVDADGVRRAKVGVLRDTYRNLYATFVPSWLKWVDKDYGRFVGSDDRPASHEFSFNAPFVDGTPGMGRCDLTVEMRAMGANTVEATCRGWELTGAFIDEADLVPREAIAFLAGRVKRYGNVRTRRSRGVWGVFNKPDVDHWLHDLCIDPEDGTEFFDQPSGLLPGVPYRTNPLAENLAELDADYYTGSAKAAIAEWYIRRMLRNEWGASVSGELIYPEFDPAKHVLPMELEPPRGSVLTIGMDGGGTPAAVIGGRAEFGRRIQYAEAVMGDPNDPRGRRLLTGVGPTRFAEYLGDVMFPRFRGCRFEIVYADPAMFYGGDRETGEFSSIEAISTKLKIAIQPAPSNEIPLRLDAVRNPLTTLCPDGRPKFMINPSCRWTRRGFTTDYKWTERDPKQPGKRLVPQKTSTSHIHDGLQYWLLGDQGRAGVTSGPVFDRYQPKANLAPAQDGWMPRTVIEGMREGAKRGNGAGASYEADFDLWKS